MSDLGWWKSSFWSLVVIIKLKYFILFYARIKNCFELALDKKKTTYNDPCNWSMWIRQRIYTKSDIVVQLHCITYIISLWVPISYRAISRY